MISQLLDTFSIIYTLDELKEFNIFSNSYVAQLHDYFHHVSSLEKDN